jgi:hypothetical protein
VPFSILSLRVKAPEPLNGMLLDSLLLTGGENLSD